MGSSNNRTERRSQSAMEYLMTYGWAILIIAVILGVLFSLGVFNPTNYAPKVPAGNCHVFRPNGPGTSFNVNLVGTCSGFLPQYTAQFFPPLSTAKVSNPSSLLASETVTFSIWLKITGGTWNGENIFGKGASSTSWNYNLVLGSTGQYEFEPASSNGISQYVFSFYPGSGNYSDGTWHNVVVTAVSNGNAYAYVDGVQKASASLPYALYTGSQGLVITQSLSGAIQINSANLQIYNVSLDANEIQYLYNEGIGGAPVYLSHLVGWWPLNGDVKDYSGNGNEGTPTNMTFNGSWSSGYTAP